MHFTRVLMSLGDQKLGFKQYYGLYVDTNMGWHVCVCVCVSHIVFQREWVVHG